VSRSIASDGCSWSRAAVEAWRVRLRGALGPFHVALGAALLAQVAVDAVGGVWRIHSGQLFPWRHLPGVPLYSTRGLLVEWLVSLGAGLCLVLGLRVPLAVGVALVACLLGLSQRMSNQQSLMLIVLAFLALNPCGAGFSVPQESPNIRLIKSQLVIVYVFSALNKLLSGFLDGSALRGLLLEDAGWGALVREIGTPIEPVLMTALSWGVVLAELVLPVLLLRRPRWGVAAVALLHASFAVALPGVLPFGLLMLAMSLLFLPPPRPVAEQG
jgi:hypothetical protein